MAEKNAELAIAQRLAPRTKPHRVGRRWGLPTCAASSVSTSATPWRSYRGLVRGVRQLGDAAGRIPPLQHPWRGAWRPLRRDAPSAGQALPQDRGRRGQAARSDPDRWRQGAGEHSLRGARRTGPERSAHDRRGQGRRAQGRSGATVFPGPQRTAATGVGPPGFAPDPADPRRSASLCDFRSPQPPRQGAQSLDAGGNRRDRRQAQAAAVVAFRRPEGGCFRKRGRTRAGGGNQH